MNKSLGMLLIASLAFAPGKALLAQEIADSDDAPGPILIGVAAPLSGSTSILGEQVVAGAEAAAASLSRGSGEIRTIAADTGCSAEGGERAAESFVRDEVGIVIGFLCTEALEAALPVLAAASIPTLDVGVRASRITDDRKDAGHLVWRIAPRSDAEADAIAQALIARWRDAPFGVVDDGTIYGRGLADAVRARLEAEGMIPATIDNFRPAEEKQFGLARRLLRTGVTRFFIAGDRPDVATIARDAAEVGLDIEIIGGEELFDEASIDVPLPEGVLSIAPKSRFHQAGQPVREDPAVNDPAQGYFGPAFVAAQIAASAVRDTLRTGESLPDVLNTSEFSTMLGPVRFDSRGDSNLDLFRAYEWQGDRFVEQAEG